MNPLQVVPIVKRHPIRIQRDGRSQVIENPVCEEIPLEICINATPYAMLMRTPGLEKELALGFCFTNELICSADEVTDVTCFTPEGASYITTVRLTIPKLQTTSPVQMSMLKFSSGFVTNAAILREIFQKVAPISARTSFLLSILPELPERLHACQVLRAHCGATHGAALIDAQGKALFCAEDVGRHNGLDKLIGHILLEKIDTYDKMLMLSSRASFEMIQKAVKIAFPVVASVSAPTDLALQVAEKLKCTYISFLKKGDFYIYTHPWRFGL